MPAPHLRASRRTGTTLVACLLASCLALSGCSSGGKPTPSTAPPNTSSPASEKIAGMTPLGIGVGWPEHEKTLGRRDQNARELALEFLRTGFPISTLDGTIVSTWEYPRREGSNFDTTNLNVVAGNGVPIPEWHIQMFALLGDAPMPSYKWSEFSDVLNRALGTKVDWAPVLSEAAVDSTLGELPNLYYRFAPRDGYHVKKEHVSVVQAYLVLKTLANEVLLQTGDGGQPGAAGDVIERVADKKDPCTITPKEDLVMSAGEEVTRNFQETVLDYLIKADVVKEGGKPGFKEGLKTGIGVASILSDLAETMVSTMTLNVYMDIDKKPLRRTTNAAAGEQGIVSVLAKHEPDWLQYSNCLRLAFAVAGVNGLTVPGGPAEITFVPVGTDNFDERCKNAVVALRAGGVVHRTDRNGKATTKVIGRPKIPPAIGEITYYSGRATMGIVASSSSNDLVKDLIGIASSPRAGAATPIVAIIGLFSRLRTITYSFSFDVEDPRGENEFGGAAGGGLDPNC